MTFNEIAYVVSNMLFSDVLSSSELKTIIERSFNFPLPVRKVGERLYSAELFHGPTLAFKDFGARFMARMLSSLLASGKCSGVRGDKLHVLIATTGNTAARLYHRLVEPQTGLPAIALPSPSAANARTSLPQLVEAYRAALL